MIETRVEDCENKEFMSWELEPKASVNKTFEFAQTTWALIFRAQHKNRDEWFSLLLKNTARKKKQGNQSVVYIDINSYVLFVIVRSFGSSGVPLILSQYT